MSDEDTTPTTHAADTNDRSPSHQNSVHVSNGKDLCKSLDNISNNMGKMASTLAKLYDPDTDERSPSLKRKSTSDLPDFSDYYSEGNSRQSGKGKRYESQTEDNLISTLVVTSWTTKTTFKGSPSVQRPSAKKSWKLPLRKQSSCKILLTVTTTMTPPVTKSRKSGLMLLKNDETRNCPPKKLKVWSKSTNNLKTVLT